MCGIVGICSKKDTTEELSIAGQKMLNTLTHRGPDSEGKWIDTDSNLFLGHRRLSIQDLSELGSQPMHSISGQYVIVYNGEIYNFRLLQNELSKLGCSFRGHSDTEIILCAIQQWGLERALEKFIGMFAFALWDRHEKILTLCRDRIGEKPLYYGTVNGTFYFASELKAIREIALDLEIGLEGLNSYFRYGYINAPNSIYKLIYKLKPGTIFSIPLENSDTLKSSNNDSLRNEVSAKSYWQLTDIVNSGRKYPILNENDALKKFDSLLQRTISNQLVADVDVGTFLSGGLDSSLVSSVAQAISGKKLKTFTIGFNEAEYDESKYAAKISKYIGSEHINVYVSSYEALDLIPELASIYDEPFSDASQIPTWLVSKIAKQNVTVCLSGDGGDELFAGYNRYIQLEKYWSLFAKIPGPIRNIAGKVIEIPSPLFWNNLYDNFSKFIAAENRQKLIGLKVQKIAGILQQKNISEAYDYLSSYWNKPEEILRPDFQLKQSNIPAEIAIDMSVIEKFMLWDQLAYLPGDNLAKVDRASMHASLEIRLPLLSHEIIEFSWRLPIDFKIRNGKSKWIMRTLLRKYIPAKLFERPKMGFSVPLSNWLRTELRDWVENSLAILDNSMQHIFNSNEVRKIWIEHLSGRYDHGYRLWTLLLFVDWYNKYEL